MLDVSKLNIQYITNEKGEKSGVILPILQFEQLLEDLQDLAVMAERWDEPTVSQEELIAELRTDGTL